MPLFLSTLSLRRATDGKLASYSTTEISIHALLAESDTPTAALSGLSAYFYPRSPCGERRKRSIAEGLIYQISIHALLAESDRHGISHIAILVLFLSTLSLRRATFYEDIIVALDADFYPRSPCGERL